MKIFSIVVLCLLMMACASRPVASNMEPKRTVAQVGAGGNGDIDSSSIVQGVQIGKISSEKQAVEVGRVTRVFNILTQNYPDPRLSVSVVVEDLGGSTDVAPTNKVYFTLYRKGEMFSTDAAFLLGGFIEFKSAKRVGPGIYEVKGIAYGLPDSSVKERTFRIDATKAISEMIALNCGGNFDCESSSKFKSTIVVSEKK